MNSTTPPLTGPTSQTAAFPHQAAKSSWVIGVIVFILVAFGGRTGAKVAIELAALLLMLLGLALGVVALFGIRKHRAKGILAPALAGIAINGLLLFIFMTNFLAARARARQASTVAPPVFVAGVGRVDRGVQCEVSLRTGSAC